MKSVLDTNNNKSQILDVTRQLTQLMIKKNTKERISKSCIIFVKAPIGPREKSGLNEFIFRLTLLPIPF
ncbi:hypothetical protein HY58_18410 [Flavihumibacter sp. ZG627]|nr:hypothetical protein HY58_18410 [Flavihumibacter sp. ZG627]